MRDRLAERAFVGQVARRDDGVDGEFGAADAPELEELKQRVLQLGLRLVDLVHDEDAHLRMPVLSGQHLGAGVLDHPVNDDGEANQVGRFEHGEIEVDSLVLALGHRLQGAFGLAGAGLAEDHEIAASSDVEPERIHVNVRHYLDNVSQHMIPSVQIAGTAPAHRRTRSAG